MMEITVFRYDLKKKQTLLTITVAYPVNKKTTRIPLSLIQHVFMQGNIVTNGKCNYTLYDE